METNNQTYTLSVEALRSALEWRKATRESFRLPVSKEYAVTALTLAVKKEVEFRGKTFVESDVVQQQIERMAAWLTSDSSRFGMLLCGECGNGKTTLVRAFQSLLNTLHLQNKWRNETWGLQMQNARDIARLCKESWREWQRLCRVPMLAIDDLGTEPTEVLDYGNVLNPVIELLAKRYDEQLFTIITTNLTPDEIHGKYGKRIGDRFNEMMERIVFKNGTYRV